MNVIIRYTLLLTPLLPVLVSAQQLGTPGDFADVITLIIDVVQAFIAIGWVLLIGGFVYGVFKFLMNFEDERSREEGKRAMVWSVVAGAILMGVYGILSMLNSTTSDTSFGIPILTPPAP